MAKGRKTIVRLPDGAVETRTSTTRVYTWAVMQTQDNHAYARVLTEWADRLTAVLATINDMIGSGDLSGLVRKHTSSDGRGEKFYSSFLPGDEDRRWGYWLPDHKNTGSWKEHIDKALARIASDAKDAREKVKQLEAGPRFSYGIVQWNSRKDLAEKACANKQFCHSHFLTTTAVPCEQE